MFAFSACLVGLLLRQSHAFTSVAQTCAKTAAYRAVSHAFPADPVLKILAGDQMKAVEDQIQELEKATTPANARNIREGFALRHEWMNQKIRHCMDSTDTEQVVIFGCGYDSRCYALQCLKGKTVFEIDLDEVISSKENILHGYNATIPFTEPIRIPFDLSERCVEEAMMNHGFDFQKKTCFVFEGLL